LDHYNAAAERNAAILTAGLQPLIGVALPHVPGDRGCSYWKYMVQLDPDELGFDGTPAELRDRVVVALRAEGVHAVVWQQVPLPALPVFRRPLCAWHERSEEQPLSPWNPETFPVASRLVDVSLALASEECPLYVQEQELMHDYVEAFRKVHRNREALFEIPLELPRRPTVGR
jgi:dTDP-4-amino-4,6-dideoxygalactose transaminase